MTSNEGGDERILGSLRAAGVQIQVEDLGAYLAGRERVHAGRWEDLFPAYQAMSSDLG